MVAVVLVSYNTRDLLLDSIATVRTSPLVERVVVVDNASTDGSAAAVRERFDDVDVIANTENVGFARAVNAALQSVTRDDVLLLNPDCLIEPPALAILTGWLREHDRCGIVAPRTVHPEGRLRVLSAGYQPTLRRLVTHYTGLSRLSGRWPWLGGWNLLAGIDDDRPREVEWVSGSCLLVRRAVLEQVGTLSERWFMYCEDMELCDRVRRAGWEVMHVPAATVTHLVGASSAGPDGPVWTAWVANLVDYYVERERPGPVRLMAYRVTLAGGLATRSLVYSVRASRNAAAGSSLREEARRFRAYAGTALRATGPR